MNANRDIIKNAQQVCRLRALRFVGPGSENWDREETRLDVTGVIGRLSACETGVGVEAADGALGSRRSFRRRARAHSVEDQLASQ